MATRELLKDNTIRIIGKVVDTRTGIIYHEVICKKRDAKYFKDID